MPATCTESSHNTLPMDTRASLGDRKLPLNEQAYNVRRTTTLDRRTSVDQYGLTTDRTPAHHSADLEREATMHSPKQTPNSRVDR